MSANPTRISYFIPGTGIDREVITNDICRCLGADALVRPGFQQDPKTGLDLEGYFITAYRPLTPAQIQDLKLDSHEWWEEKRNNPHVTAMSYQAFDELRTNQEDLAVAAAVAAAAAATADTPMVDA